jgi:acyl-coenzyme A synthetase/AMP-(fatty) acid ligase
MYVDFLLDIFEQNARTDAIIWHNEAYRYAELTGSYRESRAWLSSQGLQPGTVVSLEADFSRRSVALLLALIECGCIVVPLTAALGSKKEEFRRIAEVECAIRVDSQDLPSFQFTGSSAAHRLLRDLKGAGRPGLIVFSSGSTGVNKAILHEFLPLLDKFRTHRTAPKRIFTFLLFDHLGGINTLLYALSNSCCVVTVNERNPDVVAQAIERHRVQILPASPTFLNLFIFSEAWKRYDLSSLELVTYGTEPMPVSVLTRFRELLPGVKLQQTYGLSELGVLRSRSKSSDSLWVKVGGEGFKWRVVNGVLQVKAESAMLGYLNAPSPFTDDGWFDTGDIVEQDGEYVRFLGRRSEVINVGGQKVFPAEVESVLLEMQNVEEALVAGEAHPLTGQIVRAIVRLSLPEAIEDFRKRMREFCGARLPKYKIPQKVVISDQVLHSSRLKKARASTLAQVGAPASLDVNCET